MVYFKLLSILSINENMQVKLNEGKLFLLEMDI
jgi:hypothetical protein